MENNTQKLVLTMKKKNQPKANVERELASLITYQGQK